MIKDRSTRYVGDSWALEHHKHPAQYYPLISPITKHSLFTPARPRACSISKACTSGASVAHLSRTEWESSTHWSGFSGKGCMHRYGNAYGHAHVSALPSTGPLVAICTNPYSLPSSHDAAVSDLIPMRTTFARPRAVTARVYTTVFRVAGAQTAATRPCSTIACSTRKF